MRMVVAAVSMMVVVDRGRRWRWRRRGETVIVAGIMPGAGEHGSERAQSDESAAHGCSKIFAGFLAMHGASLVGRPPRSRCRAHHPGRRQVPFPMEIQFQIGKTDRYATNQAGDLGASGGAHGSQGHRTTSQHDHGVLR